MEQKKEKPHQQGLPGLDQKNEETVETTILQGDGNMVAKTKEVPKTKAESFILPQDYQNPLEDIQDLPIVSTRKMKKNVYFRTKDGDDFQPLSLMTISDPRDMEEQASIINPSVVGELSELADQMTTSWCHLVITRDSEKKILYTPAITDLNKSSAMLIHRARIIEEAKTRWLRMTWDADVRMHRAIYPKFDIPEPEWGELLPLAEIIFQAFEGRVNESRNYEMVQYLLGGK